jgi:hypothetical protein
MHTVQRIELLNHWVTNGIIEDWTATQSVENIYLELNRHSTEAGARVWFQLLQVFCELDLWRTAAPLQC